MLAREDSGEKKDNVCREDRKTIINKNPRRNTDTEQITTYLGFILSH